jgi:CubicO group peptidase (beta-lactamase class C family)
MMSLLQRWRAAAPEHFVIAHFDAYQDGALSTTETAVYDRHLQTCAACAAWAQEQKDLGVRLRSEMAPLAALAPAAAARIQHNLYSSMKRAMIMNNIRNSVAAVGAIAVLALVVGAVAWWQSRGFSSGIEMPALVQGPAAQESLPVEQVAPLSADVAQELDDLFQGYQEAGLFNGSVLVARGDEIIFSNGYGLADAEKETANTPQTRFRIDQMTQVFTAVAIMQLQEQGKLTVDDPICDYLDACPPAWAGITIHHLLIRSSGIADYVYEGGPLVGDAAPDQLVGRVSDLPLEFEPGSEYGYSNSGSLILGLIIERAAGQPYLTFLQENIFDPLGMANSGLQAEDGELAVGYRFGSTEAEEVDVAPFFATASLYSTVEDLYRFSRALRTEELLSQASLDQLFAPHFTSFAVDSDWSKTYSGLWEGSVDGRRLISARGDGPMMDNFMEGFQSVLVFYPDDDLTVIILENLGSADPFTTTRNVVARILADE